MKYEVGDKVRLRDDLEIGNSKCVGIVKYVSLTGNCRVSFPDLDNNYWYSTEMLLPVFEDEDDDKIVEEGDIIGYNIKSGDYLSNGFLLVVRTQTNECLLIDVESSNRYGQINVEGMTFQEVKDKMFKPFYLNETIKTTLYKDAKVKVEIPT